VQLGAVITCRSTVDLSTVRLTQGSLGEAEALAERFEEGLWCAELHRLRGVFLAAIGADETQIEASFCRAIKTAKKQKSISQAKRAEASSAECRRQKVQALGGRGRSPSS
jgi:hypothetical protein